MAKANATCERVKTNFRKRGWRGLSKVGVKSMHFIFIMHLQR